MIVRASHVLIVNCIIMATVVLLIFSKTNGVTENREESSGEDPLDNLSNSNEKPTTPPMRVEAFDDWNACMAQRLLEVNDAAQFRDMLTEVISGCLNNTRLAKLKITPLQNKDEMKYAILPNNKSLDNSNVFVTLGIGKDINAEKAFKTSMAELGQSVDFYGADPIIDTNSDLYTSIGKYFPFAVGSNPGFGSANVLMPSGYVQQSVIHVDVNYFLFKILKIRKMDQFWLDAEGAEFGIFDLYYKDGSLDRENAFMCQSNLEIHGVNGIENATKQMEFVKQLIRDKQFAILQIVSHIHSRMFLFNFGNEYCVRKYITSELVSF